MRRIAVLNDYQQVALDAADWSSVRRHGEVDILSDAFLDEDSAAAALAPYEVLCVMRERTPMTDSLMSRLPALRCVVTTGAANRSIDLEAAARLGIVVSGTTNGLGRLATAELTWGLVLAAVRHIAHEDRSVREGRWQVSVGTALHGSTLGIIGLGGVGRHVARYARAFGMDVLAWSTNLTQERALESQATLVDKDELLRRSDVVTVHTVLSSETVGLIDSAALELMKPSAYLVNTSRGPVVDEGALIEALNQRRIAGAALDTFDVEPLAPDHPFRGLPNLTLSPHLGYVTSDVYAEFYGETVRSCVAFLAGHPIRTLGDTGRDAATAGPVERQYEDQ